MKNLILKYKNEVKELDKQIRINTNKDVVNGLIQQQIVYDKVLEDLSELTEKQDTSDANLNIGCVSNSLPPEYVLRPLFIDFFVYHNEANKNTKAVEDYFDTWYNWKVLENSNLDNPLTEW